MKKNFYTLFATLVFSFLTFNLCFSQEQETKSLQKIDKRKGAKSQKIDSEKESLSPKNSSKIITNFVVEKKSSSSDEDFDQFENNDFAKKKSEKEEEAEERAGIEEMAKYRREITMPIGSDVPTYKKGFLMEEYSKALKSPFLVKSKTQKPLTAKTYSVGNVTFTERGPANIPGRTRGSVVSPTNPDTWFVGTVGGGVWETLNAGTSWTNTTDYSVPSLATSTVAISPNNANIIYAGTGEPFGNLDALTGVGIIKSTDGGGTWTYLSNTSAFGDVGRIAVDPTNANHVIVAVSSGIYTTTNGGTSWTKTFSATNKVQDLAYTNDFSAIYAGVNATGVYKSTNGGTTWTQVFSSTLGRIELDVSPINNRVVLGIYGSSNSTSFYYSDNAGTSFTQLTFTGTNPSTADTDYSNILAGQGWYDNVLRCHPFDSNIFYAGGVYLTKVSINSTANTYSVMSIAAGYDAGMLNNYVHPDQHDLTVQVNPGNPAQFRLILTNDGGVYKTAYKTNPGETSGDWTSVGININSTQFYGADKKKGENSYVAGAQDNGCAATQTAPSSSTSAYKKLSGGDGFDVLWNYNDANKLLVSSQYNFFYRFTAGINGGSTYSYNSDYGSGISPFYSKLANANNNPDVVFTPSTNGVWRSIDFGGTWNLTNITTGSWLGNQSATSISVSVANPNVVYAGSAFGSSTYKIQVSKDNGQTYTAATGVTPFSGAYYITNIHASPSSESRAYVTFGTGGKPKIIKTNDYGVTWADITGFAGSTSTVGFPNVPTHSVIEMPFDSNIIWAGTDVGLFETVDGGASWHIVTSIPPVSIWKMKIVDDQVVLATHGRGVWSATIPELSTYTLPNYIAMPNILSASQYSIHDMRGKASFSYSSSAITSLKVYVDGVYNSTISATTANTTYNFVTSSALSEGIHTIGVSGLYNSGTQETPIAQKTIEIINFNAGAQNVNINPFTTAQVYIGTNGKFVVDTVSGTFAYNVLNNSGHPYANSTNYQTYLRTPIVIGANSNLSMSHIAVTEAGYDFAVVEASKDLVNWTTLGQYDDSTDASWTGATSVNATMFKNSNLNLTTNFVAGDEVAIRLRLTSDPGVTELGWYIRSIVPTSTLGTQNNNAAQDVKMVPNPVQEKAKVFLPTTINEEISVKIYDISGKLVGSQETRPNSNFIELDLGRFSKGIYILKLSGDKINRSIKFIKQ